MQEPWNLDAFLNQIFFSALLNLQNIAYSLHIFPRENHNIKSN